MFLSMQELLREQSCHGHLANPQRPLLGVRAVFIAWLLGISASSFYAGQLLVWWARWAQGTEMKVVQAGSSQVG